ncbi:MAG TPA: hypothetical protein VFX05_01400 [Casimicrobiaceae bacterium]|nr:hypothetical protein [Casimicrobiaceae bacterium]
MMRRTFVLLAAPALLAGCQTWGPTWSEVTGERYHVTVLNRMPTVIEKIDGRSSYPARPIKVDPGRRVVELQGVPPTPGWRGTLQEFVLDAEPCKRYYLNAQFDSRLGVSRWTPVIDEVETIAGCRMASAK